MHHAYRGPIWLIPLYLASSSLARPAEITPRPKVPIGLIHSGDRSSAQQEISEIFKKKSDLNRQTGDTGRATAGSKPTEGSSNRSLASSNGQTVVSVRTVSTAKGSIVARRGTPDPQIHDEGRLQDVTQLARARTAAARVRTVTKEQAQQTSGRGESSGSASGLDGALNRRQKKDKAAVLAVARQSKPRSTESREPKVGTIEEVQKPKKGFLGRAGDCLGCSRSKAKVAPSRSNTGIVMGVI